MKATIIYMQLAYPEINENKLVRHTKSWLLNGISTYRYYETFAFGAPGITKAPDLGKIFDNLSPKAGNKYCLELGVELPDLLPLQSGKLSYWLNVEITGNDSIVLCISNEMAKVYYLINGQQYHAIYPKSKPISNNGLGIPEDSPIEHLKSMATARFVIEGDNAELAIEKNIDVCIEKFILVLNKVLVAHQNIIGNTMPFLTTSYNKNTFDYLYIIVEGALDGIFGHGRIALNLQKVILNPREYSPEESSRLIEYLSGQVELNNTTSLLHSAKGAIEGGNLRFALLQLVIASELETAKIVKERMLAMGVSKNKWGDYSRDITYSMMLNIHLFAVAPPHMKPDRNLVGKINQMRLDRNDLMHENSFSRTLEELRQMYEDTVEYIDYLNTINTSSG